MMQSIEGAFSSLVKILEDCGRAMQHDAFGQEVLNQLVSIFPSFFTTENPKIRTLAVKAMNLLVPLKPTQLTVNMGAFIQALATLKDDPCSSVRQGVCQALVALFRDGSDHLLSKLPEIMDFMLSKSQDKDEEVAREACEFWNVFCEYNDEPHKEIPEMLRSFLPRLVPVLLNGMVYSESDQQMMAADNKLMLDSVPDRPEDLKPIHYHSRAGAGTDGKDGQDDEDEDDDYYDGKNGGEVEQWNLRRCSAATLDTMAEFFGPDVILPILLPSLYERLQTGTVWDREASILALGAVASCVTGMREQLPELFPFLLQQLDDKAGLEANPQLGCTVAWTLSRYIRWVLEQDNDPVYLAPLVERLLRTMLDHNKKVCCSLLILCIIVDGSRCLGSCMSVSITQVQQAACSSFATLEEDAGRRLLPYLPHVLPYLAEAMDRYQTRSLVVLFDTLGTLADSVKHELAAQQHVAIFMPKVSKCRMAFIASMKDDTNPRFAMNIRTAMGKMEINQ